MNIIPAKLSKIKTLIMLIIILATAVWFAAHSQPAPVAMKYTGPIEILEGRSIIVNVNRLKGDSYTLVLEV